MHRGQLFVLNLIPARVLGVDSSRRMGEWVGGGVGAIWDYFSSCICPFLVGDMGRPLSNWGSGLAPFPDFGYGPAPFPHLFVSQFAQPVAFQGYKVHLCVF